MISSRAECALYSMRPHVGGLIRFNTRLTKIEKPKSTLYHLEGEVFLLLEVYSKIDCDGIDAFSDMGIPRFMTRGYLHTNDQNSIVSILMHESTRIMVAFAPHEVVLLEYSGNGVQEISFSI